jgi:hypothetical protein
MMSLRKSKPNKSSNPMIRKNSLIQSNRAVFPTLALCSRLETYRSFLNKINFANQIYVDTQAEPRKLVYFIGKGNNRVSL